MINSKQQHKKQNNEKEQIDYSFEENKNIDRNVGQFCVDAS